MKKLIIFLLILAIVPTVSAAWTQGTGTTVGYWKFENNGFDVLSLHNLTLTGSYPPGIIGNSYTTAAEDISSGISTNGFSSISINLWYNRTGSTTYYILGTDNTGDGSFYVYTTGTTFAWVLYNGGSSKTLQCNFTTTSRTMLTLTWNKTNAFIYKNGTHCINDTTSTFTFPNKVFYVNNYKAGGGGGGLAGSTFDELSLFNSSLLQEDITYLYQGGSPGSAQQYPYTPAVVNFTFLSQNPSDLNSLNVVGVGVNITYNVTYQNANKSTLYLNYTITNSSIFENGTQTSGYRQENYSSNASNESYSFFLDDNEILPGTYNYGRDDIEDIVHNMSVLAGNHLLKIELYNVSPTKNYNYFEIMANSTTPARVFYCNSSYSSGNPQTSTNCYQFGQLSTTSFNHTHNQSSHNVFALPFNNSKIGTVQVTPVSYFILQGSSIGTVTSYSIERFVRSTATQTSANNGATWTSQTYTVDAHLHQFQGDGTETLTYQPCGYNTSGSLICHTFRTDSITAVALNPTSPTITSPTIYQNVTQYLNITWLASIPSLNTSTIANYTVYLLNQNLSINSTLNKTTGLFYYWNTYNINLSTGSYYIQVLANDSNGYTSQDISDAFNIVTNAQLNVSLRDTITAATITSFNITLKDLTTNATTTKTASANLTQFDIIKGRSYNITMDATDYSLNSTIYNATNSSYQSVTYNLVASTSFIFNFFDESTKTRITNNCTATIISDDYSATNYTTAGVLNFLLVTPENYTIRYSCVNYTERFYYQELTNRTYQNLTLYLLSSSLASNVTAVVYDEYNNKLPEVTIKTLKYDASTNTYLLVEMRRTNFEGSAVFSGIQIGSEYYKFILVYDDEIRLTTTPTYIYTNSLTFQINTGGEIAGNYFTAQGITASLTYSNTTQNLTFTYDDPENAASSYCLKITKKTTLAVTETCSASPTGSIVLPVPDDSTYYGKAYAVISSTNQTIAVTTIEKLEGATTAATINRGIYLLVAFLSLAALFVGFIRIELALFLFPIPILLASISGFIPLPKYISVGVTVTMWLIVFIMSSRD